MTRENVPMAQFWKRLIDSASAHRRPDPPVMAAVAAVIGVDEPHLLAWGEGHHGDTPVTVVAVDEGLALVDPQGSAEAVAWHEVVRGGWREEGSTLWWSFLDQQSDEVRLEEPGDLPEVFNDRVTASIVVREPVPAEGGTVVIAGRRRLGRLDTGQILWTAIADGDADLTSPDIERRVLDRTAALQKEWR